MVVAWDRIKTIIHRTLTLATWKSNQEDYINNWIYTFSNELSCRNWWRVSLGKDNHALADVLAPDTFKSERGTLASGADRDREAFSFDRSDCGGGEVA